MKGIGLRETQSVKGSQYRKSYNIFRVLQSFKMKCNEMKSLVLNRSREKTTGIDNIPKSPVIRKEKRSEAESIYFRLGHRV